MKDKLQRWVPGPIHHATPRPADPTASSSSGGPVSAVRRHGPVPVMAGPAPPPGRAATADSSDAAFLGSSSSARQDENGQGGRTDATEDAPRQARQATGPRPGAWACWSLGATLAALFSALVIHYHIHASSVASAASIMGSGSGSPGRPRIQGFAGPFDVELEKVEMCEREKQGVGAAKMDWGTIAKDKEIPRRYYMSGRGSFNYNTSDDLSAKFHLASWTFPGRWVTYYSNTFNGGCSMAKNFSPERWKRVSLMVFGHEHADCPFPPIRVEVNNFTVENRQGVVKEFIYGRWKVENQIVDVANGNRVISCGRAIFRVVPKKKDPPMPPNVPAIDNSDRFSVELMEPPDGPP